MLADEPRDDAGVDVVTAAGAIADDELQIAAAIEILNAFGACWRVKEGREDRECEHCFFHLLLPLRLSRLSPHNPTPALPSRGREFPLRPSLKINLTSGASCPPPP